jgi:hypothetical protein
MSSTKVQLLKISKTTRKEESIKKKKKGGRKEDNFPKENKWLYFVSLCLFFFHSDISSGIT